MIKQYLKDRHYSAAIKKLVTEGDKAYEVMRGQIDLYGTALLTLAQEGKMQAMTDYTTMKVRVLRATP